MRNFFVLLAVILCLPVVSVGAGDNPTTSLVSALAIKQRYYAKLTAKVSGSGGGTVSAGTSRTAGTYAATSTSGTASTTTKGGSVSLYAFAKANDGYEFSHWSESDGGPAMSLTATTSPYEVKVATSASSSSSAVTKTVFAVFRKLEKLVALTGEGLRISEICPKPLRACPTDSAKTADGVDPNGVVAGWIELVNASDQPVDLGAYKIVVANRGKNLKPKDFSTLPSKILQPGEFVLVYTTEGYTEGDDLMFSQPLVNDGQARAFEAGETDGIVAAAIVLAKKVNPKKFPLVRLLKGDTVVDTVIVPPDLPDDASVVVEDPGEDGATRRSLVTSPTPGGANDIYGATKLGPNVGPLYGVKHAYSDLDPVPPAVSGQDYPVSLDVNPVEAGNAKDAIASVTLVYRTDVNATSYRRLPMTSNSWDNLHGTTWTVSVPAAELPAQGMLLQWKAEIVDAAGHTWTSPAFDGKEAGYEWYGTIVDPGVGDGAGQNSATIPTWHMFVVEGTATNPMTDLPGKGSTRGDKCMMNLDYDEVFEDPKTKTGNATWAKLYPYGARCAIYDAQTSNYYDNVRIDCRGNSSDDYYKRSHGLKFSKIKAYRLAEPFVHPVSGIKVDSIAKTSLCAEYNDPAQFRQRLSFWFLNEVGVPAPWEHPKRVNLNGSFYQFAYESPRFGEELLCDIYGLDPRGYGYKNVGSVHTGTGTDDYGYNMGTTASAGTKMAVPDDGNEKDFTELNTLFTAVSAAGTVKDSAKYPNDTTGLDDPTLTKNVVELFDLPAWLNYLAATHVTQEGDDAWGNLSLYRDNAKLLDGTTRGNGTWRPVAWDLNCSWGQFYTVHVGSIRTGIHADRDWNKCHPFYGGMRILGYQSSAASSSFYGAKGANYGFEAVFQSTKFRRLFLRRFRTLMDAYLKEPGTAESETPIAVRMRAYADEILAENRKDRKLWGALGTDGGNKDCTWVNCWGSVGTVSDTQAANQQPVDSDAAYTDIWKHYIVPRRVHLFETHAAGAGKTTGYGLAACAGIPAKQSAIASLKDRVTAAYDAAVGAVVIRNANDETIDLSGWQLTGPVKMTLPPGTVIDQGTDAAPGEVYVTADRRATISKMTLADQVVVGNGAASSAKAPIGLKTAGDESVYQETVVVPAVMINEVQSSNDETLLDEFGEDSDWVELYNTTDGTVDLSGWGLSDKAKKPYKWTFPAGTTIAPGQHLVVFCCGVEKTGKTQVHSSLSLSGNGETLVLTDLAGKTVDRLTFGALPADTSFGRVDLGDGLFETKWFAQPTPGAANATTAYGEPLGPVVFSQERGVFTGTTNFVVTLSHADSAARIWYTTDHSDPSPTNKTAVLYAGTGIAVSKTTVIRATAVRDGHLPYRNIVSQSYLYLDQVVNQTKPSVAPDTWTDLKKDSTTQQGSCKASYTVSTKSVLTNDAAKRQFIEALGKAPVMSVTLSDDDLFNPTSGVYCKPVSLEGLKKAASVEWVTGNHVFGTDAGLCAHGGASRHFEYTPKKSFGLKFRGRYGASKLDKPVMDDIGYECDEFKSLVLRAESNHSWTHVDDPSKGTSMHDQFLRDVFGAMTGFQSHGNQVHLFVNGLYWGLYNVVEALDDHFAAANWGGENEEYDVVVGDRHDDTGMEVRDGGSTGYVALVSELKVLAKTEPDRMYETACARIDLDSMIDYMLLEWYVGNTDWPQKNWTAMMSASRNVPLRYVAWDLDQSMTDVSADRVDFDTVAKYPTTTNSVQVVQRTLETSAEYRLRFADRVHRHFYNGGVMTSAALIDRYRTMADRISPMVYAEVARWGAYRRDYGSGTLYNMSTWSNEYNRLTGTYFPNRWTHFKTQLVNQGLYPSLEAAEFTVDGDGTSATLSVPAGATVYCTRDGSDPREAYTGAAVGSVYRAGTALRTTGTSPVKARAFKDGVWSALSEITLVPSAPVGTGGDTEYATYEEAIEAATSANPITFVEAPTVDNASHTLTPKGGTAISVPDYYDVTLTGNTVTFALNGTAVPEMTSGKSSGSGEEIPAFTTSAGEGGDEVGVGTTTRAGLFYALAVGESLETLVAPTDGKSWVEGTGGVIQLRASKPTGTSNCGFFRIMVKDVVK